MSEVQLLYDAMAIQQRIGEVARRIEQDHVADDPLVISPAGGSVFFLADLVRAIKRPLQYELLQVQYTFAEGRDDLMDIQFPISLEVEDRSLVITKDVVGTGVVDTYLRQQLLRRGARAVRFAALLDVPELRRTDFDVDYRLFTPKRRGVFVGYGLKHHGRYGNLDYLGRLPES